MLVKTLHISRLDLQKDPTASTSQLRVSTEPTKTDDSPILKDKNIDALTLLIESLQEDLKRFQNTQQFLKAKTVDKRINAAKLEIVTRKFQQLEKVHKEELASLKEAQLKQVQLFDEEWDQKIKNYEEEAVTVIVELDNKHKSNIDLMKEDLYKSLSVKPRTSPQQLNYQKMIDSMNKQKQFDQAAKLKTVIKKLEKSSAKKAIEDKESKMKSLVSQLETKQSNEKKVLIKKIETGKTDLVQCRADEFANVLHKFQNLRQEVEIAQQLERSKFEQAFKNYIPGRDLAGLDIKKPQPKTNDEIFPIVTYSSTVPDFDEYKSTILRTTSPVKPKKRNANTPNRLSYNSTRLSTEGSLSGVKTPSKKALLERLKFV